MAVPNDAGCGQAPEPFLTYPLKRRDGERPLGRAAALVSFLTLYLAVRALPQHDWRPIVFYLGFSALSLAACVVLALQWSKERLTASAAGLDHTDWRGRSHHYGWDDVVEAVDWRRPQNDRLILRLNDGAVRVIHPDVGDYNTVVACIQNCLALVGHSVQIDSRDR